MTKSELFYKSVDLYKKTGQGLPMNIMPNDVNILIKELIKDGLMKEVNVQYNHLPNDKFACLSNVYCVEEDLDSLTYMRIYVGIEKVVELGSLHQLTLLDAIKDPEVMKGYTKWLQKNHKELIKIKDLDDVDIKETKLSEDDIKYLKSRGWYEKNLTVGESLFKLIDGNGLIEKQISLTKEIITLINRKKNDKDSSLKHESNLKQLEEEITYRKNIKSFLSNYDKNQKIQTIEL